MRYPVDVLVAIPANDESTSIGGCLAAVLEALRAAQRSGAVRGALMAVAAHRCQDDTAALAREALAGQQVARALVVEDLESGTVGGVRHRLVTLARGSWPGEWPSRRWLFSTDADSRVPADWVVGTLGHAATSGAVAVAGLVELDGWVAGQAARRAYADIVQSGMSGAGTGPAAHAHAYAANLAVRLDAYDAVGGFPAVAHGEDRVLLERLRAASWPVAAPADPVVRTSARMPGRARGGLGTLLLRLTTG